MAIDHQDAAPHTIETEQSEIGAVSAVSLCVQPYEILKKRADFVAASRALRHADKTMLVQARNRDDQGPVRVGFTCSKKVGNAVARNRAKRRLRAAARQIIPQIGQQGFDYVLIGRHHETATADFEQLCYDLTRAIQKMHRKSQ